MGLANTAANVKSHQSNAEGPCSALSDTVLGPSHLGRKAALSLDSCLWFPHIPVWKGFRDPEHYTLKPSQPLGTAGYFLGFSESEKGGL